MRKDANTIVKTLGKNKQTDKKNGYHVNKK